MLTWLRNATAYLRAQAGSAIAFALSPINLRAAAGSAIVFAFRPLTFWFRHRLRLSPIDLRAAAGSAIVFAVLARR